MAEAGLPVFIRTAAHGDIDSLRELLSQTWHDTYDGIYGHDRVRDIVARWQSRETVVARIDQTDGEFLVADDGQRLVGMAFASARDQGNVMMLHQLYVRPGEQGRGIGGMLLDEIIESFPQARKVRLEVEETNVQAIRFYVSRGFGQVGRTGDCGGQGDHLPALILERAV
ncbi:GNAT family N-acetyltransferase [Nitratireductor luteus]|uniref:GNAT family N-acetyltransferase n=1 Tax=Nitratireductor luteus TaxID=2976980 RepID=UPI00223ECD7C|nr:GNAT family N-acetyltransferase [Nitratireductor luteus]